MLIGDDMDVKKELAELEGVDPLLMTKNEIMPAKKDNSNIANDENQPENYRPFVQTLD